MVANKLPIHLSVIRDNRTSDKALRFSNLYSRVLSLGILKRPAGILYLLHELADSASDDEASQGVSSGVRSTPRDSRAPSRADAAGEAARPVQQPEPQYDEFNAGEPPKPFLAPERTDAKISGPTKAALLASANPVLGMKMMAVSSMWMELTHSIIS